MIDQHVDISTPDGAMNSYVVRPDEGGPFPVVLFLMDAPGKREELHEMARRLSSAGYYTILSNLYYRKTPQFNVFETGDRDRMFELMESLSNEIAVNDAKAMLAFAEQDPAADTSRVGVVGYCMSGPFALAIGAGLPSVVKACASFHGVRLAVDGEDSPHRHLAETPGEIYVGCAETDHWAPPEMVAEFEVELQASGANGRVEWYPGTEHGFVFPQRPQYNMPSAERHWVRLHDLFRRNLQSGGGMCGGAGMCGVVPAAE